MQLTIHDLSRIEDAFVQVLAAIHHGRVRYPSDENQGKDESGSSQENPPSARLRESLRLTAVKNGTKKYLRRISRALLPPAATIKSWIKL